MLLTDLLPSFFDTIVLRLTGQDLLKVEREAVLGALVNCVGESVMRRVRSTSDDANISEIKTDDHFSDEWMSRAEIVDMIERSSGLDRELSEFALFLIEVRLDVSADRDGAVIREIGSFRPLGPPGRQPDIEYSLQQWFSFYREYLGHSAPPSSEVLLELSRRLPRQLQKLRVLLNSLRKHDERLFVQKSQMAASFRLRQPYQITLSEDLAYVKRAVSYNVVEIRSTEENIFRARKR